MEKVRFGIIGLGNIAARFARVLGSAGGGELAAVAARDKRRAERFAAEFGAQRSYGSYRELMREPQVELVYIALPHNLHFAAAKECLLSGKSVLCEKPMVLSAAQAGELCELARQKHLLLMEAMWTRCLPAIRRATEWAQSGRIGRISLITASFCSRAEFNPESRLFNPALAGGALYDIGVYPLMFAMGIAGGQPLEVTGTAELCPTGVDVCNAFTLRFSSGALAALASATTTYALPDGIVYGAKGRIILPSFYRAESAELYDDAGTLLERYEAPCPDGFIYEIEHAARLLREGAIESPLIPWRDSIACAGILERLREKWQIAGEVSGNLPTC